MIREFNDEKNLKLFKDKECYYNIKSLSDLVICANNLLNKQAGRIDYCFTHTDALDAFKFLKKCFEFRIAAGGVVRNKKGEVLMIYKNKIWDLPKGHVINSQEFFEDCARREVLEETNVRNLKICSGSFSTYHIYKQKNDFNPFIKDCHKLGYCKILKETKWFLMSTHLDQDIKPQLKEGITKVQWVPVNRLKKINTYQSIKEVLSYFELI